MVYILLFLLKVKFITCKYERVHTYRHCGYEGEIL